jgi:hypothetical protein
MRALGADKKVKTLVKNCIAAKMAIHKVLKTLHPCLRKSDESAVFTGALSSVRDKTRGFFL